MSIPKSFHTERSIMFDTGSFSGDLATPYNTSPYNTVAWWETRITELGSKNFNAIWFAHYASNSNAKGVTPFGGGSWYPYQYDLMPSAWQTWWSGGSAAAHIAASGFTKVYAFISKNFVEDPAFRDVTRDDSPANGVPDWQTKADTADYRLSADLAQQSAVFQQWSGVSIDAFFMDNLTTDNVAGVPGGPAGLDGLQAAYPTQQLGTEAFAITRDSSPEDYYPKPEATHQWQCQTRNLTETSPQDSEPYGWTYEDITSYTGRYYIFNFNVGLSDRQDPDWFHRRQAQGMYPISCPRYNDAVANIADALVLWPEQVTALSLMATPGMVQSFSAKSTPTVVAPLSGLEYTMPARLMQYRLPSRLMHATIRKR